METETCVCCRREIDVDSDEFRDGRYSGDELSCGRCVEDAEIKGEPVAGWTRARPGQL
jgi:hypothetical protein